MLIPMRNQRGLTLIEILMALALIGILAALSSMPIGDTLEQAKWDSTLEEMKQIRAALIGETHSTLSRSKFGFLGDMGTLPSSIQGLTPLWIQPAGFNAWTESPAYRIGSGWSGPYLLGQGVSETDYAKDAWETNYVYDADSNPITLTSLGADRVAGGTGLDADLILTIPLNRVSYSVHGVMLNNGTPWTGSCEVEIHYPDPSTAAIKSDLYTIVSGDAGAFTFSNIPPGVRSLSFYLPTKAAPTVTYGPYIISVDQPHTQVIYGTAEHPLDLSAAP